MKKVFILVSVIFLLTACHSTTGSGNIISEKRQTASFTGVNVAGGFNVEIKKGASQEVTIEADDNLIKYITSDVSDGQLKIRIKRRNVNDAHLKVYITAPEINKIFSSAGADITVNDGLSSGEEINLEASSGSKITTTVDAPTVTAKASSAGVIDVSGRTKNFHTESSSGASIRASELLSENTVAVSSSGASAHVHSSVSLDANASSGASIDYKGGGATKINMSSGGSVNKEN